MNCQASLFSSAFILPTSSFPPCPSLLIILSSMSPLRLRAEFLHRLGAADADEHVAGANLRVARGVEDHLAARAADGGDDDVELRADGRLLQLAPVERRALGHLDLLEGEVERLGRDRFHEV